MRLIQIILEKSGHCLAAMEDGAEVVSRNYAWHLGETIQRGLRTLQGILWTLNRFFGWATVDAAVLLSAQKMAVGGSLYYPSPGAEKNEISERIQQLMRGGGPLRSGRVLSLETLSWRRGLLEEDGALSQFHFHALEWVKETCSCVPSLLSS